MIFELVISDVASIFLKLRCIVFFLFTYLYLLINFIYYYILGDIQISSAS